MIEHHSQLFEVEMFVLFFLVEVSSNALCDLQKFLVRAKVRFSYAFFVQRKRNIAQFRYAYFRVFCPVTDPSPRFTDRA